MLDFRIIQYTRLWLFGLRIRLSALQYRQAGDGGYCASKEIPSIHGIIVTFIAKTHLFHLLDVVAQNIKHRSIDVSSAKLRRAASR
jgi:hypothetical protein